VLFQFVNSKQDFEGRARWGTVIPKNATQKDFDGHGTHVAGTIGGKTYGVAKKANLVAVKIFPDGENQGGAMSDIIKGLEWAVNDAMGRGDIHKCAANLSVGGGKLIAVDVAIAAAVRAGMTVCVAAGNDSVGISEIGLDSPC
jgi:subtilisin family serine protease